MAIPAPFILGYPLDDPTCPLMGYHYVPDPAIWGTGQRPWMVGTRAGGYTDGGPQESDEGFTDMQAAGYHGLFVDCRLVKGPTGQGGLPGQTTTGQYPQQANDLRMGLAYARAHPLCIGFVGGFGGSGSGGHAGECTLTGTAGVDRFDAAVILSAQLDASDRDSDVTTAFIGKVVAYYNTTDLTTLYNESPIGKIHVGQPRLYIANGGPPPTIVENMPWSVFTHFRDRMDALGITNYTSHENSTLRNGRGLHSFGTWPENKDLALSFLSNAYDEWSGGSGPPPPATSARIVLRR